MVVARRGFSQSQERSSEMALDQSKIGRVVAEQMEAIEGDYGDDCEIGDVCTIVEVVGPHRSHVRVRTTELGPPPGASGGAAWPNRRCSATSGASLKAGEGPRSARRPGPRRRAGRTGCRRLLPA